MFDLLYINTLHLNLKKYSNLEVSDVSCDKAINHN